MSWSRLPEIRSPNISSDKPFSYTLAQSKKFIPASREALNILEDSSLSAAPPKDIVPKQSSDTSTPVLPKSLYFINISLK